MSKAKLASSEAEPFSPVRSGWWLATWGEGPQSLAGTPDGASGKITRQALISNPQGMTLGLWADSSRSLPASAARACCGVIFDGVLYNGAELGGVASEDSPSTPNPAQQVLEGYLRWGEGVLARIKGIFALIIWDTPRDLLLALRDPLGLHPLFYAGPGRSLVFSSAIHALIAHPSVSRELNREALADHLCHRWPKADETFFTQVKRVPPGHILKVARWERRIFRWWDPVPPGTPVKWVEEEALERFYKLLDQAVQRALAEGPAAIFLSGGLDSVSVAAVAAHNSRTRGGPDPLALSLVFPDQDCNEESVQHQVARDLGLPQVMLYFDEAVGPAGLLLACLELAPRLSSPLLNPWLPAYLTLGAEGRSRGCGVILTGTGGDEWLGVTPLLAADYLLNLKVKELLQLLGSIRRSYRVSLPNMVYNTLWQFGARTLFLEAAHHLLARVAPGTLQKLRLKRLQKWTPEWAAPDQTLKKEMDRRAVEGFPEPSSEGFYLREMRLALDHPLVSLEKEEFFESYGGLGLRILHPYWDAELVDLLYRIPPGILNLGGRSKGLVRESLARKFPRLGFERQKKVVATNFFNATILKEGRRAWQKLGGARALNDLGVIDGPACGRALHQILGGDKVREAYRVWDVLSLEAWVRPRA